MEQNERLPDSLQSPISQLKTFAEEFDSNELNRNNINSNDYNNNNNNNNNKHNRTPNRPPNEQILQRIVDLQYRKPKRAAKENYNSNNNQIEEKFFSTDKNMSHKERDGERSHSHETGSLKSKIPKNTSDKIFDHEKKNGFFSMEYYAIKPAKFKNQSIATEEEVRQYYRSKTKKILIGIPKKTKENNNLNIDYNEEYYYDNLFSRENLEEIELYEGVKSRQRIYATNLEYVIKHAFNDCENEKERKELKEIERNIKELRAKVGNWDVPFLYVAYEHRDASEIAKTLILSQFWVSLMIKV